MNFSSSTLTGESQVLVYLFDGGVTPYTFTECLYCYSPPFLPMDFYHNLLDW